MLSKQPLWNNLLVHFKEAEVPPCNPATLQPCNHATPTTLVHFKVVEVPRDAALQPCNFATLQPCRRRRPPCTKPARACISQVLVEGPLANLKRSMVQFARPRKYEAPANRLLPGGGMRGVGELPGGLGDGTPLPMPGGMPNPAVGPRGAHKGNRRYMGGGGGGGGVDGGYATQGYDSQRSQGYSQGYSQDGYGMHSTQQSLGGLSLDSSQPGYASQGYDAQAHAARRATPHATPRATPPHSTAWHRAAPHCTRARHPPRRAAAPRTRIVTGGCRLLP